MHIYERKSGLISFLAKKIIRESFCNEESILCLGCPGTSNSNIFSLQLSTFLHYLALKDVLSWAGVHLETNFPKAQGAVGCAGSLWSAGAGKGSEKFWPISNQLDGVSEYHAPGVPAAISQTLFSGYSTHPVPKPLLAYTYFFKDTLS